MAYRDTILADSPAVYLELNETNGTCASTGSESFTGSVGAGVTQNATGVASTKAFSFNGTSTAVISFNDAEAKYTDRVFSIELWVKTGFWSQTIATMDAGNAGWQITTNGSGQLQVSINGTGATINLTTTAAIWDGVWHHIVFVNNGYTDHKLYMDGTQVASSTTDMGNFGPAGLLRLGHFTSSSLNGDIDEFAVYPDALTSTQVSTHYNAGAAVVNGGYTAQAMTASTTMPTITVSTEQGAIIATGVATASTTMPTITVATEQSVTIDTGVATASAAMPDVTVTPVSNLEFVAGAATASAEMAAADAYTLSATASQEWALTDSSAATTNSNTQTGTVTSMIVDDSPVKTIYIKFTNLNLPAGAVIGRAELTVTDLGVSGGSTIALKKVTSALDVTTVTHNTIPTVSGSSIYSGAATAGAQTYDVTDALKEIQAGTAYGLAILGTSFTNQYATGDSGTSGNRPVLAITYRVTASDGEYTAGPATASADIVSPVFVGDVTVVTQAMTASADSLDAIVIVPDVTAFVDPMTADADMGQDSGYTAHKNVNVSPVTTDADMLDVIATGELNGIAQAQAMTASGTIVPSLVNGSGGDETDPYFIRLASQLGDEDNNLVGAAWYRIDETEGTTAVNRIGADGVYRGAPTFGEFGLESRRVVGFDGINDYIGIAENDFFTNQIRIEMTVKTDKDDQILLRGIDFIFSTPSGPFAGPAIATAGQGLDMFNGRIRMYNMPLTSTGAFTGRTYLADNEWHHIVLKIAGQGTMEIWIDGQLEMRRFQSFNRFTIPDSFGGGPGFVEGAAFGPDDPSQYFRGELMELVIDPTANYLSEDEIIHNYYAAFGIIPVEVDAMVASAEMSVAKGRGNQKRALGLFYGLDIDKNLDVPNYNDVYNWAGIRTGVMNAPQLSNTGSASFDMAGYKVFPKSIIVDEYSDSGYIYDYFNEVTGEQEFIKLDQDIDMEDFDMVFFLNLPPRFEVLDPNGFDKTITFNGRFDAMFERMMDGIRAAQDEHGFSIWVPQPDVALGLGIINDYDVHSMLREANPRGPVTPFGQPTNGDYDTRALNKERLVTTVTGLTDFGGWILRDYIFGFGPTNGANYLPPNEAWDYVERPDGLLVGDELFYSQDFYNALGSASWFSGGAHNQRRTVISIPEDAVLAGTPVTREGLNHYVINELVENPWKNNVVSIVVNPGDPAKGHPVNGKIYVNFMDSVDGTTPIFKKQIVPPNEQLPLPGDWETPEQREWDYSSTRVSRVGTSVSGSTVIIGDPQMPADPGDAAAWANYQFQLTLSQLQRSGSIISVTENEKYPTTYLQHYPMIMRAFAWLQDREEVADGDKVIRVAAFTAQAEMPSTVAEGQKHADFTAEISVANATMVNPEEVVDPDVGILALPMTAFAEMTGYSKTVDVSPMTATAEMVENFDVVHAGGEQVVLYLNYTDATVYLKEDI